MPANTQTAQPDAAANAAAAATAATLASEAAATAVTAERTRISGILGCEEAKGRTEMANHIAMNTNMSVDEAKAMLNVAPKKAEAAAPGNAFAEAMDKTGNPNVGADNADSSGGDAEAPHLQILRAQEMATGQKLLP